MGRYLIVLFMLISVFMTAAAQDTTFTSEDGTIKLTAPEGWQVSEDHDGDIAYINLRQGDDVAQLQMFDLRQNQCTDLAFEDPMRGDGPYLPCEGSYRSVLAYGAEALWPTYDMDHLTLYDVSDTSGCYQDIAYVACVKDVGFYKFLILFTYLQSPETMSQGDYTNMIIDMSTAVIESATYGEAPTVSSDAFPHPKATENGWTLDLSAFKLHDFARVVLGMDGLFYVAEDGKIVIVTPDGEIKRVLDNDYLLTILDLAVMPDGTIWVLNGNAGLYEFSPDGTFVGEIIPSFPSYSIQIEATSDGKLIVLEMADMATSVNIRILDAEGTTQTIFSVRDDETFSFTGAAEAFLSMSKLGAASSNEIYVFSELDDKIRSFDGTGKVIIPSLADEFARPSGFKDHFGFTDEGIVDVYADDQLSRVTLKTKEVETVTLPSTSALILPDDKIMYYLNGTLIRDVWKSDSANK